MHWRHPSGDLPPAAPPQQRCVAWSQVRPAQQVPCPVPLQAWPACGQAWQMPLAPHSRPAQQMMSSALQFALLPAGMQLLQLKCGVGEVVASSMQAAVATQQFGATASVSQFAPSARLQDGEGSPAAHGTASARNRLAKRSSLNGGGLFSAVILSCPSPVSRCPRQGLGRGPV